MTRFAMPLRYEQVAIIAAITAMTLMGIGGGLPSKEGMDLLLEGGAPTPRQVQLLNSLHTMRALGQIPVDSLPPRRMYETYPPTPLPPWYSSSVPGPWLGFTEVERLYALRSYILSTSTVDEDYTMVAIGNMNPRKLDFDPKRYIYGGSYLYPVAFMLFVMQSTGALHVTRDFSYYLEHPSQISRIYVAGRALNLLALIGTLIILALLGRLLSSELAGTLSMLTYGLSTLIISYTVQMKPHVFTAFWVTLAVWLLVLFVRRRSRRFLVLSILAAGYAAGSSAPAAAVGLLYPVVLFERGQYPRTLLTSLAAMAGMAIVFLIMNPYSLLQFDAYRSTLATVGSESGTGLGVLGLHKLPWYLHGAFVQSYTFPVGLLGLLFMLWCSIRGSGPLRRLAMATVSLLLLFGMTSPMVRISAFVAPMFCLFAGFGVTQWILVPLRARPLLRAGLVVLLFLPGAMSAGLLVRHLASDNVWREPTARWVRSSGIGPGTTIGVFFPPNPSNLPPFPILHANLIDLNSAAVVAAPPEYVVVGNYRHEPLRLWKAHPLRSAYRLVCDLGQRPPLGWFGGDRTSDEARTVAFVYQRIAQPPAAARPDAEARLDPGSSGVSSPP